MPTFAPNCIIVDICKSVLPILNPQVTPKHSEDGQVTSSEAEMHVSHKVEEEGFDESGQASVYVYKRENETAAEIVQPLISQDPRQFRLSGHRMQEVMQMDRALTEHGRAEVVTDSYRWISLCVCVCWGGEAGVVPAV